MKKAVLFITFVSFFYPLLFCGCNFATHSYNNGRLLDPGETMTTLSAGGRSFYTYREDTTITYDYNRMGYSTGDTIITPVDTTYFQNLSFAFDYRLGVLSKNPFGKGLEVGFLIELPVQYSRDMGAIPLLQFDGRFGLPDVSLQKSVYHHNASVGWIMGQWVDNSWFIEYAGGFEYRTITPYFNGRVTRVGTDQSASGKAFGDNDFLTFKKTAWNVRLCTGVSFKLPVIRFLPDYIVPEIALFFPMVKFKVPGVSWHIGMRWLDDK
jgi:hypothetical protein